MDQERTYIAIDLKSFYASVECAERGLDALTTNLVVADASRTDKTICLAASLSRLRSNLMEFTGSHRALMECSAFRSQKKNSR